MAHNITQSDHIAYVGEVPWHGLGTAMTDKVTPLEALQIAKLDWEVQTSLLQLEDGRPAISRYERPKLEKKGKSRKKADTEKSYQWKATMRSDTKEILGIVGPDYHPFQNRSLARIFEPVVESGAATIETCGSLFGGRKVWMMARMKGVDEGIRKNDEVRRYLLLAHGHDGRLAVRFGLTPIRVVCWNTLSAAVFERHADKKTDKDKSVSRLVRMLHTANLSHNLETMTKALDAAEELFMLTCEEFRKLASRGVSKADLREYARIVVRADKDEKEWTGPQTNKIAQIVDLAVGGKGNTGSSWWDAYNGVTEYFTWHKGQSIETRFDSNWLADGVKENQRAFQLAVDMAT